MGRNRYDDAVAFLQGCLEIWRRKLDPGDEAIAAAIRKLAELRRLMGRDAEAVEVLKQPLPSTERADGA